MLSHCLYYLEHVQALVLKPRDPNTMVHHKEGRFTEKKQFRVALTHSFIAAKLIQHNPVQVVKQQILKGYFYSHKTTAILLTIRCSKVPGNKIQSFSLSAKDQLHIGIALYYTFLSNKIST